MKQGGFDALDKYPCWIDHTSDGGFYSLPCYEYPNMIKVNISSVLLSKPPSSFPIFLFPCFPVSLSSCFSLFLSFPSLSLLLPYSFNPLFLILSSPSLPFLSFSHTLSHSFSHSFFHSFPLFLFLPLFSPSPTSYLSLLPYLSLPSLPPSLSLPPPLVYLKKPVFWST